MNLLDDAARLRSQLVLHLHRLDHNQARTGLNLLPHLDLHADHEPGHGGFDDAPYRRLPPLPGQSLDLLRAVILPLALEPLPGRAQRPAPAIELLAGDRPGLLAQEEMNERRRSEE